MINFKVCDEMYDQNIERLKSDILLLVGICETGVDITWQVYISNSPIGWHL